MTTEADRGLTPSDPRDHLPGGAGDYGRQFAGVYDRIFPHGAAAHQTAAWLAGLHPGDGRASLELGVGTGRIALPLADLTGEVVGVDSSAEMLDVLREALAERPLPVEPVLADMRDYSDERDYGLVLCVCGTLSMVLDPDGQQRVLDTCARAVGTGGAVVIETHNPGGVEAMHDGRLRDSFFTPYPEPGTGLLSHSTLDPDRRIWQLSHIWFENGGSHVASEVSRLTSPDEVDAYAARAGLVPDGRYGDWAGTDFAGGEPTFISVYRPEP
jgi:SAM-dependent methyltransferase